MKADRRDFLKTAAIISLGAATNVSKAAKAFGIQYFMLIDEHAHITVSKQMAQKLHWVNADVKFTTLP